jgi:hypothetical protein
MFLSRPSQGVTVPQRLFGLVPMLTAAATESETPSAQAGGAAELNIVVIEGEGAVNNVKQRTTRELIIEVNDTNYRPVGGAIVTLTAPGDGAGATFGGSKNVLSLVTGNDGRITTSAFEPNHTEGAFYLRITVSSEGRAAARTITQTNSALSPTPQPAASQRRWLTPRKTIFIAAVVAAAVVIAIVASHQDSYSPPSGY